MRTPPRTCKPLLRILLGQGSPQGKLSSVWNNRLQSARSHRHRRHCCIVRGHRSHSSMLVSRNPCHPTLHCTFCTAAHRIAKRIGNVPPRRRLGRYSHRHIQDGHTESLPSQLHNGTLCPCRTARDVHMSRKASRSSWGTFSCRSLRRPIQGRTDTRQSPLRTGHGRCTGQGREAQCLALSRKHLLRNRARSCTCPSPCMSHVQCTDVDRV